MLSHCVSSSPTVSLDVIRENRKVICVLFGLDWEKKQIEMCNNISYATTYMLNLLTERENLFS